jgi:hypothetical protein
LTHLVRREAFGESPFFSGVSLTNGVLLFLLGPIFTWRSSHKDFLRWSCSDTGGFHDDRRDDVEEQASFVSFRAGESAGIHLARNSRMRRSPSAMRSREVA